MSTATIKFFPRKDAKSSKSGRTPIYARITINRTKAETRLPIDISIVELRLWNESLMRFDDPKMNENKVLGKYQQLFEEIVYRNAGRINEIRASELNDQVFGKKAQIGDTATAFLNDYFLNNISRKASIDKSTIAKYKTAIRHFTECLDYIGKSSLPLNQIDRSISNKFYDYLLSAIPELNKTPLSEASTAGVIKKIKAIFARANEEDLIHKNPFSGMKLKPKSPPRDKLNTQEISEIINLDLTEFPSLNKVRNIFLFSVYTGLAFHDAMTLKKTNIQKWKNGELLLHLSRAKTDVQTKQFLITQAVDIIKIYDGTHKTPARILPEMSNQQLNIRLKLIREKAEITKDLSTHIARHTFRQLLAEAGISDIAAIKTMMGHSRKNDIDSVYHNITERQLLEAKNKFQEFINTLFEDNAKSSS